MSTFDGLVNEFPDIRIDYFRTHTDKRPPSACFLSHIHSDHLLGLESLKMPFVYCSAATKRILLRMEKYPHRINFQKGILESRKQTYKHLKKILRELPLQTPVELELGPKITIRVTLFDANHCPGAVMFLIEGDGKAILYTGDIRAEPWWVNSIVRSPLLLPYSCGQRRLDCIYLDTTFASHNDIHKEFPTKAEGLNQLLTKVKQCPKDSVFYFRAWTLGYEDVWIVLSSALKSKVHVDDYQLRLFASLAEIAYSIDQGAALVGCAVGNQTQSGCLITDSRVSIHSCEPGMECHAQLRNKPNTVWITPIISTLCDGTEVAEIGAGGGGGDLYQVPELEIAEEAVVQALQVFCNSLTKDKEASQRIKRLFQESKVNETFKLSLEGLGLDPDQEMTLNEFVDLIMAKDSKVGSRNTGIAKRNGASPRDQQRVIHFPYSRHSSFSELRHLVSSFQPKDVCPCTVDLHTWSENLSIEALFGDLCTSKAFRHDKQLRNVVRAQGHTDDTGDGRKRRRPDHDSQETASQSSNSEEVYKSAQMNILSTETTNHDPKLAAAPTLNQNGMEVIMVEDESAHSDVRECEDDADGASDISISDAAFDSQGLEAGMPQLEGVDEAEHVAHRTRSKASSPHNNHAARRNAYRAAKSCLTTDDNEHWRDLRLRSTGWRGHTEEEMLL